MSNWISVEDELPLTYVNVLVYPRPAYTYSDQLTGELRHDGKWVVEVDTPHQCYTEVIVVTHWQYLPEPPK